MREFIFELKNIRSLELISIATNVVEKILWGIFGLCGIAWAFYFLPWNFQIWMENPSYLTKADIELAEIDYPAITIATPGSTKYAIAERLGNYIKPNKLPKTIRQIRSLLLECSIYPLGQEDNKKADKSHFKSYQDLCFSSLSDCKVSCSVVI